jgi:hypothetical protein
VVVPGDGAATPAAVDTRVLHCERAEELVEHVLKVTTIGRPAIPLGEGLQTFYGSRNSPRATVTAEPPTSNLSACSAEPCTRA